MHSENTPAPTPPVEIISGRNNRAALVIVVFTATLGATFLMSGFAHAEPMMSTVGALTDGNSLQQTGFGDHRFLFGTLTFGFSLLAAGVWHRSFRAAAKPKHPTRL